MHGREEIIADRYALPTDGGIQAEAGLTENNSQSYVYVDRGPTTPKIFLPFDNRSIMQQNMMQKIVHRVQRRRLREAFGAHWEKTRPEQHLAIFQPRIRFRKMDRAANLRILQWKRAFLRPYLDESIRHARIEPGQPWHEPQPGKVRIDGYNEPVRVSTSTQLDQSALNMSESHGDCAK